MEAGHFEDLATQASRPLRATDPQPGPNRNQGRLLMLSGSCTSEWICFASLASKYSFSDKDSVECNGAQMCVTVLQYRLPVTWSYLGKATGLHGTSFHYILLLRFYTSSYHSTTHHVPPKPDLFLSHSVQSMRSLLHQPLLLIVLSPHLISTQASPPSSTPGRKAPSEPHTQHHPNTHPPSAPLSSHHSSHHHHHLHLHPSHHHRTPPSTS
jgi:hypothetical protein